MTISFLPLEPIGRNCGGWAFANTLFAMVTPYTKAYRFSEISALPLQNIPWLPTQQIVLWGIQQVPEKLRKFSFPIYPSPAETQVLAGKPLSIWSINSDSLLCEPEEFCRLCILLYSCSGLSGSVLNSGEAGCLWPFSCLHSRSDTGISAQNFSAKDLKWEGSGVIHFKAVAHGTLLWPFTAKAEFGELIWQVDVYFHNTSWRALKS